jgi:outer membrane biosynthesis protein TonB
MENKRLIGAESESAAVGFLIATITSLSTSLWSAVAPRGHNGRPFEPGGVVSATDIKYTAQGVAVGTVVLELTVDEKGLVEDVHGVRQMETLTGTAVNCVKGWQFKPALLDGKPTRSRIPVAVQFNSVATHPYETALGAIPETQVRSDSSVEPQPTKALAASFVRYPPNSQTTGTVVLRAAVDTEGLSEKVVAIRDVPALTEPCIEAVKRWKFQPAQLRARPISSSICVAFVLRPPN